MATTDLPMKYVYCEKCKAYEEVFYKDFSDVSSMPPTRAVYMCATCYTVLLALRPEKNR